MDIRELVEYLDKMYRMGGGEHIGEDENVGDYFDDIVTGQLDFQREIVKSWPAIRAAEARAQRYREALGEIASYDALPDSLGGENMRKIARAALQDTEEAR